MRAAGLRRIGAAFASLTLALGLSLATATAAPSNVPDVLARREGLVLEPMPRAARTYALNCQGCHGEAGRSVTEIPTLAGRVGYFARLPEGRRYLAQVPNVALNPSSDEDIAAVLNWVLERFGRDELPADFVPYSAAEVAGLRAARIDAVETRRQVVAALAAARQIPSVATLSLPGSSLY